MGIECCLVVEDSVARFVGEEVFSLNPIPNHRAFIQRVRAEVVFGFDATADGDVSGCG